MSILTMFDSITTKSYSVKAIRYAFAAATAPRREANELLGHLAKLTTGASHATVSAKNIERRSKRAVKPRSDASVSQSMSIDHLESSSSIFVYLSGFAHELEYQPRRDANR